MTKVVVTSDLHLGITSVATLRTLVSTIAAEKPALTVLAGDIGEGLPNVVECLKLFAQIPGEVAMLAGNHDVWARANYSSQDLWERHLPEAVQAADMLWLEGTVWQRDGVAVAGSLAWYDYSAVDPTIPPYPPEFFAKRKGSIILMQSMFIGPEGLVMRPGFPEGHALSVSVLGSDYHAPVYAVIDSATLEGNGS